MAPHQVTNKHEIRAQETDGVLSFWTDERRLMTGAEGRLSLVTVCSREFHAPSYRL